MNPEVAPTYRIIEISLRRANTLVRIEFDTITMLTTTSAMSTAPPMSVKVIGGLGLFYALYVVDGVYNMSDFRKILYAHEECLGHGVLVEVVEKFAVFRHIIAEIIERLFL